MRRFLLDSSCMVAMLCAWHASYEAVLREVERRLDSGEALIVAVPALIETYSVLTRMPLPFRILPADCLQLLETDFLANAAEVVALDATAYLDVLRSAALRPLAGGQVYDAVIYGCGVAANVDTLLTLNGRHFRPLVSDGMEIVVPA